MEYIIFDLEWNQAAPYGEKKENKALKFEIIEIGAVRLDEKLNEVGVFHSVIKPQVHKKVNSTIQRITHISQEEMNAGEKFESAIERFRQFCTGEVIFCTWGSVDLLVLQQNMHYFKAKNTLPFPLFYYDVQRIYRHFTKKATVSSLADAATELSITDIGEFHRAITDAKYTAQVFRKLPLDEYKQLFSIDYYRVPRGSKGWIRQYVNNTETIVTHTYSIKSSIMADRALTKLSCCCCDKKPKRITKWTSSRPGIYIALAICKEHGWFLSRIRIQTAENKAYYAIKKTRLITQAKAIELRDHQKAKEEKREQYEEKNQNRSE